MALDSCFPGAGETGYGGLDGGDHRFVFPDFGSGRIPVQTGGPPEGFGHIAAWTRGNLGSSRQLYILRAAALLPDPLVLEVKGIGFG